MRNSPRLSKDTDQSEALQPDGSDVLRRQKAFTALYTQMMCVAIRGMQKNHLVPDQGASILLAMI